MPNWSTNHYAIKGHSVDMLAFLNLGLKNSGVKEEETVEAAFESLLKNGKTRYGNFVKGKTEPIDVGVPPKKVGYDDDIEWGETLNGGWVANIHNAHLNYVKVEDKYALIEKGKCWNGEEYKMVTKFADTCGKYIEVFNGDAEEPSYVIDKKSGIIIKNEVTFETFTPIPDTFLLFDTTNIDNYLDDLKMRIAANHQKREYGCVGWYEYRSERLLGTKWNTTLNNLDLESDGDIYTLTFHNDTAWTTPSLWLTHIKELFPRLAIFICAHEENNEYDFYCEIESGDNDYTIDPDDIKRKKGESDDDYYNRLWEYQDGKIAEMVEDFQNYVADFNVDSLKVA